MKYLNRQSLAITCLFTLSAAAPLFAQDTSSSVNTGAAAIQQSNLEFTKDFASLEGLMRLIPELRNKDGNFELPDPRIKPDGLNKFLNVHQSLLRLIEMGIQRASLEEDPYSISKQAKITVKYPEEWIATEVGVETNNEVVKCNRFEQDQINCASYKIESFLSKLKVVPKVEGHFYYSSQEDPITGKISTPNIVYTQATALANVSLIKLSSVESVGIWSPGYVLHDDEGNAFLIIDICVDLYNATTKAYDGELFAAIHLPKPAAETGKEEK